MKLSFLTLAGLLFSFFTFSQKEISNFNGLESAGEIPLDFSSHTKSKFETEKNQNKSKSKNDKVDKDLLLKTNYSIDQILHSGNVIFNDPVTLYVDKIVSELLKDDPKLREEIRVYTIKSNETNAFSTRQGILFVTTGLISQLENEAQLAFILAHEIAHYTKKHVIESFEENEKIIKGKGEFRYSSNESKIKLLSKYSKDKEFQADEIGIDLYLKSDYNPSVFQTVFQVLQYSYLPFDDLVFPATFFNDSSLFIPKDKFPEKINPITGEDDYDDTESSHPNIKNRIEHVDFYLEDLEVGNGSKKYIIGKEEFNLVKTLCRFESIELDIMNGYPASALYSIFLLKKSHPDNYYLDKNLAKAWYKLLKFKNSSDYYDVTVSAKKIEGESHAIHYLVRKLKKKPLNVIALKSIYNVDLKYGFDSLEVHSLWLDGLKDFLSNDIMDIDEFYTMSYHEALQAFEDSKIKKEEVPKESKDTTLKEGDEYFDPEDEERSKYDRINSKKNKNTKKVKAKSLDAKFDTDMFYEYAWADIIEDKLFKSQVDSLKKVIEKERKEEEEDGWDDLTYRQQKKINKKIAKKGVSLGIDKVLILSPEYQKWHHKKGINDIKSEKGKIDLAEIYRKSCDILKLDYQIIDKKAYSESSVDEVNDLNVMMEYIYELLQYDGEGDFITTKYDKIKKISESRNLKYVLLPLILVEEQKRVRGFDYIALIYPLYWPYFFVKLAIPSNDVLITNVVFNIEENKIEYVFFKYFKRKLGGVPFVEAHIYDILFQISNPEKKAK